MKRALILISSLALAISLICTAPISAEEIKFVLLPKPQINSGRSLMQVLKDRSSSRSYGPEKLSEQSLSNLLWAAFGINRPGSGRRTAPSAADHQEIDIYVATAEALYLYEAGSHALKLISADDIRALTGRQEYVKDAAVNLVYVADLAKMGTGPKEEQEFYAAADTGFISQNVYLYCASERLATIVRGSIDKQPLAKAMNLRPDQKIILAQSVGYHRK